MEARQRETEENGREKMSRSVCVFINMSAGVYVTVGEQKKRQGAALRSWKKNTEMRRELKINN